MAVSTITGAQNAGHGYTETFLDEVRADLGVTDDRRG